MKHYFLLVFWFLQITVFAQDKSDLEKPPVFPECNDKDVANLKNFFYNQLSQFVFTNFKVPQLVRDENYNGEVVVLFEVNAEGNFVVIYTDAIYDELKVACSCVMIPASQQLFEADNVTITDAEII
mgnify:CR=1 FL=1